MNRKIILELKNISKSFPGVKAVDNVSLCFREGEVHVLFGENGAGKSTLIKIISGVYRKDNGSIILENREVNFNSPRDALENGISVIYQELSLIPDLTVAENIFLGREIKGKWGFFLIKKIMYEEARKILLELNLDIDPRKLVSEISIAERQMVEIAKAISQNSKLVIMDEPTSSLSEKEVNTLFEIIGMLKRKGVGIIYISHRIQEIRRIGDRISILKDGALMKTLKVSESKEDEWVSLMIGREIKKFINREKINFGKEILKIKGLTKEPYFRNVTFSLKEREILGIYGLIGAGRTDLLKTIFGYHKSYEGRIEINGKQINVLNTKISIKNSIGLIPEDRRNEGLLLNKNIIENISLPSIYFTSRMGFLNRKWEWNAADTFVSKLHIKTPSLKTIVENLSGGNQQKVVIAKWLALNTKILLLDEPTRGIDVNAKAEIYELMNEFTRQGGSIIMVSSELPEILGICDRILVMREGEISIELDRSEANEQIIINYASIN